MEIGSVSGNDFLKTLQQQETTNAAKNELGQSDFFKLMIKQLEKQDPFEPQKGADFIAQMAQFSAVEGIENLNKSMDTLGQNLTSNQSLDAMGLIGRDVQIPSEIGLLSAEKGLSGSINVTNAVSSINISITDEAGNVVKKMRLGEQAPGVVDFKWDGVTDDGIKAQEGRYAITAEGITNGAATALTTNGTFNVDSVLLGNSDAGVLLNIKDFGQVEFKHVVKAL